MNESACFSVLANLDEWGCVCVSVLLTINVDAACIAQVTASRSWDPNDSAFRGRRADYYN